MLGPEVLCNLSRNRRLIVRRILHSDGKGLHPPAALLLHQGHDRSGINSCRKKCSQRHIRHHLVPDRSAEKPLQLICSFLSCPGKEMLLSGNRSLRHRPVDLLLRVLSRTGQRECKNLAGLQLEDILIDGIRSRDHTMFKIQIQHLLPDRIGKAADRTNAAKIRGKGKNGLSAFLPVVSVILIWQPGEPPVVQRLLSDPVSCQCQRSGFQLVKSNGEHSLAQGKRLFHAVKLNGLLQHLGIAGAAERDALSLCLRVLHKLRPDTCKIIDLSVVDNGRPSGM